MMKPFACLLTGLVCLFTSYGRNAPYANGDHPYLPSDSIGYTGTGNICQGSSILLTANYIPAGASFQWTKNGVDIPGETGQTYTATATGLYSVKIIVANDTLPWPSLQITVHPYPVAAFNASPSSQCASVPVQFTNTSAGATSYVWNFDDPNSGTDNSSQAANPLHQFAGTAGNGTQNFNVQLIADIAGCKDTATSTVTVKQSPGTELGGTGYTVYNGLPYFTQCASATSVFTFGNQSSTAATNTNYVIKWGDGSPDFTATSWMTTTHTYGIGTFQLQFIVSGQNGCADTTTYYVFVGNNPAVGLNNPGNTFICSGTSLTFPISGTSNNPPGTVYTVIFNDGTPANSFPHPAPPSVTHLFSQGSCGTNSGSFANSFQASIQASNPCGTSAASVVPIYVSQKGMALFSTQPGDTVCVNNTVTVTNTSLNAYGVSSSGVCTQGKGIWSITPATGWTVVSGSLGNDLGTLDPSLWIDGSTALGLKFTTPGVYSIKLRIGAFGLCGADSIIQNICVNPAPQAAFSLSANQGCAPLTVTATNSSNMPVCGSNTYQWTVSYSNTGGCMPNSAGYSFINGTNASSPNPQFQFTNPGVYTIRLVTISPGGTCISAPVLQTVTVKEKPGASINAAGSICQNGSVNPVAVVNNCYSSVLPSYSWSFPGGIPASSSSEIPGPVVYNSPGIHTITLTVTNECGSTTVTKNITVNPAPDVTVPASQVVCAGGQAGGFSFTSSLAGTSYTWTNSNPSIGLGSGGSGHIAAFTALNSTTAPLTATITVVPLNGCTGPSQSFNVTVNPVPSAPVVTSPVLYCLNEPASALTATPTGSNLLTWYTSAALINGSATAPLPNTASAGSTAYYITQSNGLNCESAPASITVTVYPSLGGNTISSDQTICANSSASQLASAATVSGGNGSYSYQWQQSTDGGASWTNIPGGSNASYSPGSVAATTWFRRLVTSSSCADTSNTVVITVQGSLSNYDIAGPQTICEGTAPALLAGQAPGGGTGSFSYQWQSSVDNLNWSNISAANAIDYQPAALNATTYYRRITTSGFCSGTSSAVTITVNPRPVMNSVTDKVFCNGAAVAPLSFGAVPASNTSYAWTNSDPSIGLAASGSGNLPGFTAVNSSNPKVPVTGTVSVIPTYTSNSVACTGDPVNFDLTILPMIVLAPINDTAVCKGSTIASFVPQHDGTTAAPGASVSFNWTVSGSGTLLTNGSGLNIPALVTFNSGNFDLVTTITVTPVYNYNGFTCNGMPESYMITVKPGTPQAQAGMDIALCEATGYTMMAFHPPGTTGSWVQLGSSSATIVNPSSATTQVTGLVPGTTYQFEWTLAGFASCPVSKDTIVLKVDAQVVNSILNATQTICAGQSVTITGNAASGGNGVYQYQWQESADNVNWNDMPGQTNSSLSFIPSQTVYVRRVVTSLPCFAASASAQVIVQPALANNMIAADQAICIGTAPVQINGALPSGGSGIYQYQWQQSTDAGASWSNISGASSQDYAPGVLTVTTRFRRLVSTSLCNGPQSSTSNAVVITVNPDADAMFNPTSVDGCIPFVITPAVINLQPSASNGQYAWYADNIFLGTGTSFPGFTMTQADDTVVIKLVAVSASGCLSDSISREFHTYKIPQPSFTLSDTVGCGPLSVLVTNTTPEMGSFGYYWDFGNGLSSAAAQPGSVLFLPAPDFGDTVYTVKLHGISLCDTMTAVRTIRVKSKPKALFTPDHSVGCSPMTVVFNNISAGIGNTYTWDFGDGSSATVTNSAGLLSHVFHAGVQDTFLVRMVASNDCGSDTMTYSIVVSPNAVQLDFAINGNQFSGCTPHTVQFINNSSGASAFTWNFGDGNIISTTKNIDTVSHSFLAPGSFTVTLFATNGCSDTTATENIEIYAKPQASFTASPYTACIGNTVQFTNSSSGATSYLWQFGDAVSSTLTNPQHIYTVPGLYTVKLIVYSLNVSGTQCVDSTTQQIQVVAGLPGWFTVSDTIGHCSPFTVSFSNQNLPAASASWDFGDGTGGNGDIVSHTYTQAGTYQATLTANAPGGCTYTTTRTIKVEGPAGTWTHTTGFLCNGGAANFQVAASNYDSLIYDFGDGSTLATTSNLAFHSYVNGGSYVPSVVIKNNAGCQVLLPAIDTIKVDKIQAGFTVSQQAYCGYTDVSFTDTSLAFFGKAQLQWNFGDGSLGSGSSVSHQYTAGGAYPVKLIVTGNSGCTDTIVQLLNVVVNNRPAAAITVPSSACAGSPVSFGSNTQSADALNILQWTLSNGVTDANASFSYTFTQPGTYNIRFVAGTVNGCYDTVNTSIQINPAPVVAAGNDINLCRGSSAPLSASGNGVVQWSWSPLQGLSCYSCPGPIASPLSTTPYLVQGVNSFGCADYDTVVVTVIQPINLTLATADSICIGESTNLLASGASVYSWSPPAGLNNTSIPNPAASPMTTTTYRVVGYDGFNCFTDTAFVTVAVGQYPVVSLGPDLVLPTGTQQQLVTSIQNGPVAQWEWSPATNLSCNNCPLPSAYVEKDISYVVKITTAYGCGATDTVSIKTFCESAQVFIPNAFTPNGDGFNDVLMVRASGVALVKSFRVFNRWGEVVFERGNFQPNQPQFGWDGRIKGVAGGPDVFVYTAEVICDNGTSYTYKGNVSLLK